MRLLTMLSGFLMIGVGIFLIANGGITFLSVAFIVGLVLVVCGFVECLSYNSYRGDDQERTWVLIDGTTTFVLGGLILMDKISADAVVPMVLGFWVIVTGIRNFTRAIDRAGKKDAAFFEHLLIGAVNVIFGIYVFFDKDIFNMAAITMVGLCLLVQGLNLLLVGGTIVIKKPEFAKTKHEKLAELKVQADQAHIAAKEAIKLAKEAKAELKEAEAMPEEAFDLALAPRPVVDMVDVKKPDEAADGDTQEPDDEKETAEDSSFYADPDGETVTGQTIRMDAIQEEQTGMFE